MLQPIAVVGMSCRFPGAPDLASFWHFLRGGYQAKRQLPDTLRGLPRDAGLPVAAYLDRVDLFDAAFFGISPHEADSMDPQQRLVLELSWEALEDANILPLSLSGTGAGVFLGAMWKDYGQSPNALRKINHYSVTGEDLSLIAGRVSHFLNLNGPSMVVQTASSSSLVSVHLACQALRSGEVKLALAGGVSLILGVDNGIGLKKLGALAPDGVSKPFSDRADGYGRGEGAGLVVLKTLERARADGDRIYATILSSVVNHDGASRGIAVPSLPAQTNLLRDAYRIANVESRDIQYIEAHGSGTPVGDVIEAKALEESVQRHRLSPAVLGSVKAQIGHLEAAAGIAGLIKMALFLWHDVAPSGDSTESSWSKPAIAGVSSFGLSGTNCHVVLQGVEAVRQPGPATPGPWIFSVSGRTPEALKERALQVLSNLSEWHEANLASLCFTASARRTHYKFRRAIVCQKFEDLSAGLRRIWDNTSPELNLTEIPNSVLAVSREFECGLAQPDWAAVFGNERCCDGLPVNGWERERFWHGEHDVNDSSVEAVEPLGFQVRLEKLLGLSPHQYDPDQSLIELGLDSLRALELEAETQTLGLQIPVEESMGNLTLRGLVRKIAEHANLETEWEITRL